MMEPLHIAYRPTSFDQVIGQDALVRSLKNVIKRKESQAFLFHGPSGCGKTTLARIASAELGCKGIDINEVPAAKVTGIEDTRVLQDTIQYMPFGGSRHRSIILDECHGLSTKAWDSLLKAMEEPPPHLSWFLCTTNPSKVPVTIKTRCTQFAVKSVKNEALHDLIADVCNNEDIKLASGIADLIVRESHGSPRQVLVNLALCRDLKSKQEAAEILQSAIDSESVLDLCRLVCTGGTWQKIMSTVNKFNNESPEGARIQISSYIAVILKNDSKMSNDKIGMLLEKLDAFSTPYNQSDGLAPLIMSLGKAYFGN